MTFIKAVKFKYPFSGRSVTWYILKIDCLIVKFCALNIANFVEFVCWHEGRFDLKMLLYHYNKYK